jgi:two-component system, OmpR family, sensor histidine kinase KdpD
MVHALQLLLPRRVSLRHRYVSRTIVWPDYLSDMSVGCPGGVYPMNFTLKLISESATVSRGPPRLWREYLAALAITGACTAIAFPLSPPVSPVNVIMLYIVGTTLGALRMGRGPSALTAVTNTLAFNYFFVPPVFSFEVDDVQYVFAMGVMLIVALVIANLMISIRRHSEAADARERRTAVLYAMSRELAVASDAHAMAAAAIRHIRTVFHCSAVVLIADEHGHLSPIAVGQKCVRDEACSSARVVDRELARHAAAGTARCVDDAIYLPLHGSPLVKGAIVVWPQTPAPTMPKDQLHLLDAFAVQLALSLQRARLVEAADAAKASADRAVLRNTLLASISHDLRTPLSAIAGAGSLIAQAEYALNADRRTTLGLLIERKARDMSQLLTNVLELMQMELGSGELRTDWHTLDDLVSLALQCHEARLAQWRIAMDIPADLPLVLVEATLVVKILGNLFENIGKYTPSGTNVTISAARQGEGIVLTVADDGPGLPPGDPERLFDKFQRGAAQHHTAGVGLGLAICRAAARLHGGDICAKINPGGGARFEVTLPAAILRAADSHASAPSLRGHG